MGQPTRTTNTPPRKKLVALALCLWKKNLNVRSRPMTKDRPDTNRICQKTKEKQTDMIQTKEERGLVSSLNDQLTFPMARRALSKKSIIPKKRKNTPNPVSPIPISEDSKGEILIIDHMIFQRTMNGNNNSDVYCTLPFRY